MLKPLFKIFLRLRLFLMALGVVSVSHAHAIDQSTHSLIINIQDNAPIYEEKLQRISEILGALHYLSNLCRDNNEPNQDDYFRQTMLQILDTETANEPERRAQMTARYNRGYRAFASVHVTCTNASKKAEQNYRQEGFEIASDLVSRFGS